MSTMFAPHSRGSHSGGCHSRGAFHSVKRLTLSTGGSDQKHHEKVCNAERIEKSKQKLEELDYTAYYNSRECVYLQWFTGMHKRMQTQLKRSLKIE